MLEPVHAPGGLVVRRHGRLGDRRRPRGRRARRPAVAPLASIRGYGLPSWTMPGTVRPLRELLGQHRGDARLLRGRRRARRPAASRSPRAAARRSGPRGRRARDPAAGRPSAACGGRLHARVGARDRRATSTPAPAVRTEIDAACARSRSSSRVGPGRRLGQPRQARRAARPARTIRVLRRRADGAGRGPLEDARSTRTPRCRRSRPSFRRPTTTRSSAGRAPPGSAAFSAVFLEDSDQHPRVRQRIELTARLIDPQAAGTLRSRAPASGARERVMSLVMLGDLVSIYLAVLRGVDPTPVDVIELLKSALTSETCVGGRQLDRPGVGLDLVAQPGRLRPVLSVPNSAWLCRPR